MRHQIGGDERDAFRIAHQRLQRGPFAFQVDAVAAPRLLHPAGCASLRLSRGILCRLALLLSHSAKDSNSTSSLGSAAAFSASLAMRLS